MSQNKKAAARQASRSKSKGSNARRRSILASETATVGYDQAKLLSKAAQLSVPNADDISVVASTIQTDEEGKIKNVWTRRTHSQALRQELFVQAIEKAAKNVKRPKVKAPTKRLNKDLLAVYPIGDPHIGMYAWEQETGAPWDLRIAEEVMMAAIDDLVARAPAAETALLVDLGDHFHADNLLNQTMRSGHPLDVDTRYGKVKEVGIRIAAYQIEALLRKHKKVHVIIEAGNHDDASGIDLQHTMKAYFRNEPRVTIDMTPGNFHYFRFGNTLIGTTHGHGPKMKDLPGIMAADRPKDWGDTEYRQWLVGHVHHHHSQEFHGCTVEYFRTLAARDAWAYNAGYRGGRDQQVWTVDRQYGIIRKEFLDIARINDLVTAKAKSRKSRRKAA